MLAAEFFYGILIRKKMDWAKEHMENVKNTFCSPMSVVRSSVDSMDVGEAGTARRAHVLTGSGVNKGVAV